MGTPKSSNSQRVFIGFNRLSPFLIAPLCSLFSLRTFGHPVTATDGNQGSADIGSPIAQMTDNVPRFVPRFGFASLTRFAPSGIILRKLF